MGIGGTTQFDARKPGYLLSAACRDPRKPVEIAMTAVPPDSGQKVCKAGVMHPERQSEIRLELERGALDPGETGEDFRLSPGPEATVTIVAAPGRSIQWQEIQASTAGWSWAPLNSCEAPAEGYVTSLTIPSRAGRGLCFVRRDDGPTFGAFTIDPAVFVVSEQDPAVRYICIHNRSGGRGLCTEKMVGWAASP
jgi:hypothetical protein